MEYNKLVSVTGMGGLFELLSSKADGGIVRSLEDNTSKFVSNRKHNFSHLESIEIYTTDDNINLVEVFMEMDKSKEKLPEAKADNKTLQAYFGKVVAGMDFERVYASDMKKMIKWFEIIKKNNIELKMPTEIAEGEEDNVNPDKKTPPAKKPSAPKVTMQKSAPAKKINTPRKMA